MRPSFPVGMPKLLLLTAMACAGLSLVVLVDFALPSRLTQDVVVAQQASYNRGNRGGAGYFSYATKCRQHNFACDEQFSRLVPEGDTLQLGLSPIFKEVNWYTSPRRMGSMRKTASFRYATGLGLPLVMVGFCLAAFYFRDLRFQGLLMAVQILTIINFIGLLR